MSRRDLFHDAVRRALEKQGWTITHDPYLLPFGERRLRVDLGAEMPLGAEKEGHKIAVEIKNFVGFSEVAELEKAIGQFMLYDVLLEEKEPERALFLAVPGDVWLGLFAEVPIQKLIARAKLKFVVYRVATEEIVQWTT